MSDQLKIEQVRHVLIRLEETIIFALIERSQFLRNAPVYQPGYFGAELEGESLCGFLLLECERSHAKVRRYTSPDEHPFFDNLPAPILPALGFTQSPLIPNTININSQIRTTYETELIPMIAHEGDDEQYGSTAVCDTACLQALSKRIHYGKFVAESKARQASPALLQAMQDADPDAIMAAITDEAVEQKVLDRVMTKARLYTNELNQAGTQASLTPEVITDIYRRFIIPTNKSVQVTYLLQRHL